MFCLVTLVSRAQRHSNVNSSSALLLQMVLEAEEVSVIAFQTNFAHSELVSLVVAGKALYLDKQACFKVCVSMTI